MLRGLTTDFQAAGHEVTVLLDSRIAALNPPINAEQVVQIAFSGEADSSMETAAETADAAYVIAPEPDHVLQSIVECIETTGTLSLNCQSSAIEKAADKAGLSNRANRLGLCFPKTITFKANKSTQQITRAVKELDFPIIIKPANGAGCNGVRVLQRETQVANEVCKIKAETASATIIAQEFVEGTPVSVSLICTGEEALPVSLNLQDVALAPPDASSRYNGGLVPFEHPLQNAAFAASKCLSESFRKLRGYVGVDMVLTGDNAFVIEINPRLTTSYVGLRKTLNFNVAQAIINSVLKGELPLNPQNRGYACFSKVQVSNVANFDLGKNRAFTEVISPPFLLKGENSGCALLQTLGNTSDEVSLQMHEAKRQLQQIFLQEIPHW
jgi:tyramine---L-glutamate ligase